MAYPTVTYIFANDTRSDATQINTNFTDLINAMSTGASTFNIGALSCLALTATGDVTLGDAVNDDIFINGSIASHIVPKTTGTYNLGSSTYKFANIYSDTVTATTIVASAFTIPSFQFADGAVDAPSIAFTSYPATGFYLSGVHTFSVTCQSTQIVEFAPTYLKVLKNIQADESLVVTGSSALNGGLSVTGSATFNSGIRVDVGGGTILTVTNLAITSTRQFLGPQAFASEPTYSFSTDTDTGIFSGAVAKIGFSTAGAEVGSINAGLWTIGASGGTQTHVANGQLDILSGGLTLKLGGDSAAGTRTNNTVKYSRIGAAHYQNAEEPVALIFSNPGNTSANVHIGGGTASMNAATDILFYTAANNTTTTGTTVGSVSKGLWTFGESGGTQTHVFNGGFSTTKNVGIGSASFAGAALNIGMGGVTATTAYGIRQVSTFPKTTTGSAFGIYSQIFTEAVAVGEAYVVPLAAAFYADTPQIGANSTVTRAYGLRMVTPTIGGTGNAWASDSSVTGNYGIYLATTNPSYFAGPLKLSSSATSLAANERLGLYHQAAGTGATGELGIGSYLLVPTSITMSSGAWARAISARLDRNAASADVTDTNTGGFSGINSDVAFDVRTGFTYTNASTYGVSAISVGAPSNAGTGTMAITNYAGINIRATSFNTGTNKYGLYIGAQSGATNNYAIYTAGGETSRFGGRIGVGADASASAYVYAGYTSGAPTGTAVYGFHAEIQPPNTCTAGASAFLSQMTKQGASTLGFMIGAQLNAHAKAAGIVDRAIGAYVPAQTIGGTGNAAICDNLTFTGSYFINSTSANPSLLSGALQVKNQADPGAITDGIAIGSVDLSAGNATLSLRTETAVVTETVTSDRTLSVQINGVTYKILLKV